MLYRYLNDKIFMIRLLSSAKFIKPNLESKITIERTITREDVDKFSILTGDNNKVHFNTNGVVHGTFLNGLVSAVIGTKLPGHGTLVLSQNLLYPNPCPINTTVIITVEITSWRKIISCVYNIKNKIDNTIVLQGDAKLIKKNSC